MIVDTANWLPALLGGMLVGTSACLLLLFNGRIAGMSGIINGIITPAGDDISWRLVFIIGFIAGAILHHDLMDPDVYNFIQVSYSPWLMLVGGILVGIGTRLGEGCTSGHGVCGLGRLSLRSLVATLTFILIAMITVFVARHLLHIL